MTKQRLWIITYI